MGTTTNHNLRYPEDANAVAVPADVKKLADDVDAKLVSSAGGTVSGNISFTGTTIVQTPTANNHAANKSYVDTQDSVINTELGTNPSGTFSTVKDRLDSYTTGFNTVGNLLTANQASVETDLTGWGVNANCTIERSWATPSHGGYGIKATALANNHMSYQTPSPYCVVEPGETYTFNVSILTPNTGRSAGIIVIWYTEGGGVYLADSSKYEPFTANVKKTVQLTAVAPATATRARFVVEMLSATTGDTMYSDCFGYWKGAGGKWAMPGTPIVGGSHIATNGAYVTSGTVAPEGNITAPPLSRYQQVSGAATVTGAMEWVKATGTGNTGWVAGAEADTGWRDVTASLANGWSGTNCVYIRRVGNRVQFQIGYPGITGASKTGNVFYVPPSGFATATYAGNYGSLGQSVNHSGSDALAAVTRDAGTGMQLTGATTGWTSVTVTASWITADAWPASLPGSAA